MRLRTLGRTGLKVSDISLGTVEIGLDYGVGAEGLAKRPPESEAARLLHEALDSGINFIDTARAYGDSEDIIGRALQSRREQFILCSKVSSYSEEALDFVSLKNKVSDSVEQSLRALRTDWIDILMIHSAPTEVIVQGELARILADLRSQGKCRWIGASTYGVEAAHRAICSGTYDCLQIACSAIDRRLEQTVFPEARQHHVGIVARSVLLKGALTSRYQYFPENLRDIKEAAGKLENIAKQAGISLPELAYRYVLGQDPPQTALVGAASVEEVKAAVQFANAGPLPDEVLHLIKEVDMQDEQHLNPASWGVG